MSQPDHEQLSFLFPRTYCTITLSVIITGEILSDRAVVKKIVSYMGIVSTEVVSCNVSCKFTHHQILYAWVCF